MYKSNQLLAVLCGTLAMVAAGSVDAATIAEYGFTSNSLASSDTETNSDATSLASGGGVPEAFDGSEGQPAPSLALSMGDINDGTLLDSDYYTFTITPDAGFEIDFTQFSIDINKLSGGADVFARLYSSIDTFSSEIGNASVSPQGEWNTYNIDLAALPTVSTPTEFRVYLETSGTFDPNGIRLDNLVTTGEVIPEPGSLALMALGGLLIARRRRD